MQRKEKDGLRLSYAEPKIQIPHVNRLRARMYVYVCHVARVGVSKEDIAHFMDHGSALQWVHMYS